MMIDEVSLDELVTKCDRYIVLTEEVTQKGKFDNFQEFVELRAWFRAAHNEIELDKWNKEMSLLLILMSIGYAAFLLASFWR